MRSERGAVLINALIVVLTIAAIAAALLTRSEAARSRLSATQTAEQLDLYLDAAARFTPELLGQIGRDGFAHDSQIWAKPRQYDIDQGRVTVRLTDLQGRLNVNWLLQGGDFVDDMFRQVFAAAEIRQSLIAEIADFISPSGPRGAAYLRRTPSVWPRGGAVQSLDDLREVEGMTPQALDALGPYLSALPFDTRLNLNTAPDPVKRALIAKLPDELIAEIMGATTPLNGMAEIRQRLSELLETEEFDAFHLDRMTTSSSWFRAELHAELNGHVAKRVVLFELILDPEQPARRVAQWAVYD